MTRDGENMGWVVTMMVRDDDHVRGRELIE